MSETIPIPLKEQVEIVYEELERIIQELLGDLAIDDIQKMPTDEWTALREKFLNIKGKVLPTGEVVYE